MSGRDQKPGPIGKIKEMIRTVSESDDTRDPLSHGYQRVQGGNLSTSTTATSLDTILIDDTFNLQPSSNVSQFTPIIEGDDLLGLGDEANKNQAKVSSSTDLPTIPPPPQSSHHRSIMSSTGSGLAGSGQDLHKSSKPSLKGSRVSFGEKKDGEESEDESFENRRGQFQQQKTVSFDHRGILKDLKHILANDNRRQFQSKKHVSLDLKGNIYKLGELLKESSSDEEEFRNTRKDFQSRKHQSLDARAFKGKVSNSSTESSDDDVEKQSLIHRPKDITKPIIVDLKDLETESEEDEDFQSARQNFQKQKSMSIESRRSRFFEMDEIGSKKGENIRQVVPFVRQITEDGKPKLEVYRPTTNPIYIWTQALAAIAVSLGSLVVGFCSAYTSPALVSMTNTTITAFEVTPQEASWVGGLMPLAGLAGGICGGPLIEYLGRKNTILATALPFIISGLIIGCAVNVSMVFAGRALAGFCVGVASLALPVYLGETVQPEVRGTLGLLPTAFGNIGILICFVAGTYLNWSELAFLGAAIPVPFLLLTILIPETPRWFVSRNKEERARKALVWLRGKKADVEPELKGIVRSQADAERQASKNSMFELLKRKNLKPLSISLGLMFFQQLSGINAVIFYTVKIFEEAGSTIDSNVCTIIVGIVNFIATFIATVLIDRLGRKILLYISDVAMVVTLFILGGFFYCKNNNIGDVSSVGWLPLTCFVIYVLGFSMGFGPIPWLMMGEILPAKIRGSAASVATAFNWTCTFIVTKTFQDMIDSIGISGAFWLFGCICVVAMVFVILYVPETQGKTLEDIERKMMGRVRRMSSVANIKPLSFNM